MTDSRTVSLDLEQQWSLLTPTQMPGVSSHVVIKNAALFTDSGGSEHQGSVWLLFPVPMQLNYIS